MIGKQIIILLSLAFLAVVTLADSNVKTFREKWIEWGKNPHIDQFGEFVDVDTECNGKPCNYPEEIVPYSSEELSGPFCVPADKDQVICNYLPQNATLVSESEFDRIFPGSSNSIPDSPQPPKLLASSKGSGPEPPQASQVSSASKGSVPWPSQTSQLFSVSKRSIPKPSQASHPRLASKRSIPKPSQASHPRLASNGTLPKHAEPLSKLEKRSRFAVDGVSDHWVWQTKTKITYRVAFVDGLKTEKLKLTAAVSNGIEYWKNQCGLPGKEFFQNWTYLDNESSSPVANIWFYFVKGVVCEQPAAFACAFFPHDYADGKRTTVYVNWDKFKDRSTKGISMIMAHEIGHVLGLSHENIDKNDKGEPIKAWKVSNYDKDSLMHSYHDISKQLTKTDCRAMAFYNDGFTRLQCGPYAGGGTRCKKLKRYFVKPRDVRLRTNEVLIDTGSGSAANLEDIADYTCLGSDMSEYMLNAPVRGSSYYGYFNLGVGLTQCLGVRVPSDLDHIYVLQSDGNFVSYHVGTGTAVWSTQSQGRGTPGDYSIVFQTDGNLVIYDKNGVATWSSASYFGSPSAFRLKVAAWQFQKGHMYLTDSAGRAVWGTHPALVHEGVVIQQKTPDGGGASGWCVDTNSLNGGATHLSQCTTDDNAQRWNIYTDGTIRNKQTGYCLFDHYAKNEGQVNARVCDSNNQQYQWQLHGDGTIRNRYSNKCLDNWGQQLKFGTQIQVYDCINAWSEKWWVGRT